MNAVSRNNHSIFEFDRAVNMPHTEVDTYVYQWNKNVESIVSSIVELQAAICPFCY